MNAALEFDFNGPAYEPEHDQVRLSQQHLRIRKLMGDGQWRTLAEIARETGDPQASASAQLRHLRKKRFGAYLVEKRSRGERSTGLYEYRVTGGGEPVAALRPNTAKRIRELVEEVALLRARLAELEAER